MSDAEVTESTDRLLPVRWAGHGVVAGIVVLAAVMGSRLWFFSDDWNIIAGYHDGNLLEPFNSHLSLVPVALYRALFETVGLGSYAPYRLVGLIAYAVLGLVTLRYARGRIGDVGAALATALVLWNSGGVTNVMFPFLLNFSVPVAAVAAVWWHLDRTTARHDAWASWWLVLALATSGLGLMTAVAVGVELLWTRPGWKRWAILAPGPVLWLAWYAAYGVDSPPSGGLRAIVSYAARMLIGGFGSLTGGNRWVGLAVASLVIGLLVASVLARTFDGRVLGGLAAPLAFAVLTAVSRIGVVPAIPPDELRYRWTIGAFLVLAVVQLLSVTVVAPLGSPSAPVPHTPSLSLTRLAAAFAALAVVVNGVVLVGDMSDWADTVEAAVPGVRDNLWAAEAAQANGSLDRDRALPVSYVKVTAGEYVDAVVDLGSPLEGLDAAAFGGSADSRRAADEALVADLGIVVRPDGPENCPDLGSVEPQPIVAVPGEVWRIVAEGDPVNVGVGYFGAADGAVEAGRLAAGEEGFVTFPSLPDDAPIDDFWLVVGGPARVTNCSA